MNRIAEDLDRTMRLLDAERAHILESLVRKAIEEVERGARLDTDWPEGYFEATAGVLAGERFERPPQGELPHDDN